MIDFLFWKIYLAFVNHTFISVPIQAFALSHSLKYWKSFWLKYKPKRIKIDSNDKRWRMIITKFWIRFWWYHFKKNPFTSPEPVVGKLKTFNMLNTIVFYSANIYFCNFLHSIYIHTDILVIYHAWIRIIHLKKKNKNNN